MGQYLDINQVAERLGVSQRHVRRMCDEGRLVGAIKSYSIWKIPATAHEKLRAPDGPLRLESSRELMGVPAAKRTEAIRRLGIIREFEKFALAFVRDGHGPYGTAMDVFVGRNEGKPGKRCLYYWLARYRDEGLIGLVDGRGGGRFFEQIISAEAFELFKSMYLTPQQLSVKTCYRNICYISRQQQKKWKIPHLRAMYRFAKDAIPMPVQVLHREGLAAYEAKCAPYVSTDPDSIEPGAVWVGDHSPFNCWIRHRGRWVRPWITAWQDMRSRMIVGWYLSAAPNQTTILLAARRAIEKYGPSDSVKIDNGKDYDSQMWTGTTKARRKALRSGYIDEQMVAGIYAMMDVAVSFAIPYHPQSKPIERFFDTLDCQFTKTLPTYCGKDTQRRPDDLFDMLKSEKALAEACDMAGFVDLVEKYIEVYNNTAHSGRGMDGRSPAEVMATRTSRRVMAEGVLDLLMRVWSGELIVGKNGVRFKGLWYGQFDAELLMAQGKKVRVAYDPDDLRSVHVYDAATLRLITIAEQNRLIAYGSAVSDEDLRSAMRQKARAVRAVKDYRDSRLAANMDLASLTLKAMADARKEPPKEQTQTLRPVRTPLNTQVKEHKRRQTVKAVRKAAGAEGVESVLDMNFELLKGKNKYGDIKLLDD